MRDAVNLTLRLAATSLPGIEQSYYLRLYMPFVSTQELFRFYSLFSRQRNFSYSVRAFPLLFHFQSFLAIASRRDVGQSERCTNDAAKVAQAMFLQSASKIILVVQGN